MARVPRGTEDSGADPTGLNVLPRPVSRSGRLYVAVASDSVRRAVGVWARDSGRLCREDTPGLLTSEVEGNDVDRLCDRLRSDILCQELGLSRVDVLAESCPPPNGMDVLRLPSVADFLARVEGEWLIEMLLDGRTYVAYQPIVDLQREPDIYGYECLFRGLDSQGRTVLAGRLFEQARNMGFEAALDFIARYDAVERASELAPGGRYFLNILPRALERIEPHLGRLLRQIESVGMRPEQFTIEVVETQSIENIPALVAAVCAYREAGIRVALDDLGSGYSSLNLLTDLKPDFVKLDIGLMRGAPLDRLKGGVVKSIVALAHAHSITVVAEGIEDELTWTWAKACGVDLAQGFFFAYPAPSLQPKAGCAYQTYAARGGLYA